ncbi:MAG: hypothetical protein ABR591_12840, partial [Candidatus Velthaea sp.]
MREGRGIRLDRNVGGASHTLSVAAVHRVGCFVQSARDAARDRRRKVVQRRFRIGRHAPVFGGRDAGRRCARLDRQARNGGVVHGARDSHGDNVRLGGRGLRSPAVVAGGCVCHVLN